MARSWEDDTILLICAPVVAVTLLALVCQLFHGASQALDLIRWACTNFLRAGRHAECRDDLWQAVCKEQVMRRVRQYRILMKVLSWLLFLAVGNMLWNLVNGKEDRLHSPAQDVITILAQGLALLVSLRPSCLTAKTLDLHYAGGMLCCAAYAAPFACKNLYLSIGMGGLFVTALDLFSRNARPLFFACNAAFASCAALSLALHGQHYLATMQVLLICVVALGSHALEVSFTRTLHRSMQFEEVKELHAAASALLRSFCECTAELDAEGVITSSEELGSFLMRGDFSYSLAGWRMAELLVEEEERQAFQARLKQPRMERVGLAEIMPASIKDGCGNLLRLELMWVGFRRADGSRRHLLGVREFSDCRVESKEGVGEFWAASAASQLSSLSVDTMAPGFPVLKQSDGLAAQIGHLPRDALLADFIRKPGPFMRWVQAMLLEGQSATASVVLLVPWGRFKAECTVPAWDESQELERVDLLFTDIRPLVKKAGQHKGTPGTPLCRVMGL